MEFYTPGICILVKEKPETIRKCRNTATACHNSEPHPLNSVNWNLLRICKSLWGHTISQGEKRAKKLENFSWLHLGLWQAVFPLNYSVLKTLHTFERLKISSRVKAATCFVLTTGMQSRIYNLLKHSKLALSWKYKLCCSSDLASILKKKETFWKDPKDSVVCCNSRSQWMLRLQRLVKDLLWKDAIGGGSLFV